MSSVKNSGSELQRTDSSLNDPKSPVSSSDLRTWVALEYQILRETIPGPLVSDEAIKVMLDRLTLIANEIGTARFHMAILKAIDTCERRPTIATIRKLAGVSNRLDPQQEAVVNAWAIVVRVLERHIGRDGNGNVVLQSRHNMLGPGNYEQEPVPDIPVGVKETVRMMGGWGALYASWPEYAGQKWNQFLAMYRGEPSTAISKISA